MGDMLPYMLARVDLILGAANMWEVGVQQAYAKNVWVTTSGFFSLVPFRTWWAATASDRIMAHAIPVLILSKARHQPHRCIDIQPANQDHHLILFRLPMGYK